MGTVSLSQNDIDEFERGDFCDEEDTHPYIKLVQAQLDTAQSVASLKAFAESMGYSACAKEWKKIDVEMDGVPVQVEAMTFLEEQL